MPVTAEENAKYLAFVQGMLDQIGFLQVEQSQLLWHYTSGDALINIVDSGNLYATQVACLNDSTEVLYGNTLLREAMLTLQAEEDLSGEETNLVERFTKEDTSQPTPPSDWFVTCFSEQKDDLSQWRAYGGGENGYAIAFLAGAFFGRGSKVARVNYDREVHLQGAKDIAKATIDFFREGLEARSIQEDKQKWQDEFIREWDRWIGQLAPMVKDPAFRGEHEYRIIHEFQNYELGKLRFRQKQSLMSLHLPLIFPPLLSATQSSLLPITEVMVGPSRHKEQSRLSVELLLRQKGYSNAVVSLSEIPFQNT